MSRFAFTKHEMDTPTGVAVPVREDNICKANKSLLTKKGMKYIPSSFYAWYDNARWLICKCFFKCLFSWWVEIKYLLLLVLQLTATYCNFCMCVHFTLWGGKAWHLRFAMLLRLVWYFHGQWLIEFTLSSFTTFLKILYFKWHWCIKSPKDLRVVKHTINA